jgi:hypothetical protein
MSTNPNIVILRYEDIEEELSHGRLIREQPFVTRDGVEKAIRDHWMSWAVLILTGIAAIAAVVAAFEAFIPLFPKGQ